MFLTHKARVNVKKCLHIYVLFFIQSIFFFDGKNLVSHKLIIMCSISVFLILKLPPKSAYQKKQIWQHKCPRARIFLGAYDALRPGARLIGGRPQLPTIIAVPKNTF